MSCEHRQPCERPQRLPQTSNELAKKCRDPARSCVHIISYYKSGLRDRSTRCAFPCTHSTCDSNGASLGHLLKSAVHRFSATDSSMSSSFLRSILARIKAIFISGMSLLVRESVSPICKIILGDVQLENTFKRLLDEVQH